MFCTCLRFECGHLIFHCQPPPPCCSFKTPFRVQVNGCFVKVWPFFFFKTYSYCIVHIWRKKHNLTKYLRILFHFTNIAKFQGTLMQHLIFLLFQVFVHDPVSERRLDFSFTVFRKRMHWRMSCCSVQIKLV